MLVFEFIMSARASLVPLQPREDGGVQVLWWLTQGVPGSSEQEGCRVSWLDILASASSCSCSCLFGAL
jgi:hypothetical protein